ncbi:MAG TPA: type II secretion system F family protein [Tepidisphaeraceae bacterium]|nr:type II secretion system F family protein [Tepidisphaeraceae bacterium]
MFVGTALSVFYEMLVRYPASVRQRLREATGKTKSSPATALLNLKQLAQSASEAPSQWPYWTSDLIQQSGLSIELKTVILISMGLAVVIAVAAVVGTHTWWTGVVGLLGGLVLPWAYVLLKRHLRIRQLTRQLPDALDVMCRAVRAGQTVPASFQMVADDFAPPISDEFRHCYEQQNLGLSYDASLRSLAQRTGIMELRILVVALLVQCRSGGSLIDLMQNLATTVRKRLILQQKVKSLTGEGRLQAIVLIALPFLVFLAIYFLNREYAQVLLDHPRLLMGCVFAQTVGALVIHRLIQIDY